MSWMSVHYQEHFAGLALHETLQKHHEQFRVELAGIGRRPKLPASIDGADHVETLSLAGGLYHRCLTLQSVRAAQGRIGLKPRFVLKEDLCPQPLGPFFELRIPLLDPLIDQRRVPLVSQPEYHAPETFEPG